MMIDDMMDDDMMMKYDDEMMEQSAHVNPPLLPRPPATCIYIYIPMSSIHMCIYIYLYTIILRIYIDV